MHNLSSICLANQHVNWTLFNVHLSKCKGLAENNHITITITMRRYLNSKYKAKVLINKAQNTLYQASGYEKHHAKIIESLLRVSERHMDMVVLKGHAVWPSSPATFVVLPS